MEEARARGKEEKAGEIESWQMWDKLFKIVGENYPEQIAEFVLGDEKDICIISEYKEESISLQFQIGDINYVVIDMGDNNRKKVLNIEVYTRWTTEIREVVYTRNAIITRAVNKKEEKEKGRK